MSTGVASLLLEGTFAGSVGWTCRHVHRGGSQGAEVWGDATGRKVVVKRHPGAESSYFRAVVERIERARKAGVPAPATVVAHDGTDVLLVHDYLPGRSNPPLTIDLVEHLLQIVDMMAGLGDSSAVEWSGLMDDSLTAGLTGYCEHGSLASYSDESRALLARIKQVGSDEAVVKLEAPDLVHYDLHPDNVLSDDGLRVSGVIDWDAVRTGDAALDLALLAFTSSWRTDDEDVLSRLWTAFLTTGSHDARNVYMHHVCLRLVDWIIRHGNPPGADRTIELARWALAITETGSFTPIARLA